MKPKTAPTSPKYALEQEQALEKVWQANDIRPPAKIPLISLALWSLVFTVLGLVIIVGALGWYIQRFPNSRLKDFLPASVTTVIENVPSGSVEPPSAVKELGDTTVALVAAPAKGGLATDAQITGGAVALSSSGWLATINSAIPSGTTVAAATTDRYVVTLQQETRDPASAFVFFRAPESDFRAVPFADAGRTRAGQSVWVMVRRLTTVVALRRQLIPAAVSWQDCDRWAARWVLDEPANAPMGSAVVNDDGQVVGLIGPNAAVWTMDVVEPILRSLLDRQVIERPSCGFQYIPTTAAAAATTLAEGLLVGAEAGGSAITAKGSAETAGLKAGDRIVAIEKTAVTDWSGVLRRARPGQKISLSIIRDQAEKTLSLTFGILRP